MTARHVTTAVTMVVLCLILVIAGVVGFNSLFAPLPNSGEEPSAAPSESCAVEPVQKGRRLRSRQVVVNVYNAGDRGGLAGTTMDALRQRGFRGGTIGNAPEGTELRRVQVWIADGEEDAGRLVARQFGPKTPVETVDTDLADGIDVLVGNQFRSLKRAPRSIKVQQEVEGTC